MVIIPLFAPDAAPELPSILPKGLLEDSGVRMAALLADLDPGVKQQGSARLWVLGAREPKWSSVTFRQGFC